METEKTETEEDESLPTERELIELEKLLSIYNKSDLAGREGQFALLYKGKLRSFAKTRKAAHRRAVKKLGDKEVYLVQRVPGIPPIDILESPPAEINSEL